MSNSVTGFLTGGLFGDTPDYGGAAIQNEKNRKNAILQGMHTINSVFGGGTDPTFVQASGSYDPSKSYFSNEGGAYRPWHLNPKDPTNKLQGFWNVSNATTGNPLLNLFNPFDDAPKPPDYRAVYNSKVNGGASTNNLFTMGDPKTYEGFGPNFYNQRVYDYINYALPQLGAQQKQTSDSINYGLANRGILNSSAAGQAKTRLAVQTGIAEQGIADQAQNNAQDLKTKVEGARQASINQLYQTGDPSQSSAQAISAAAGFQVPQAFGPISNMFSTLAQQYAASQLYNQYNPSGYGYGQGQGQQQQSSGAPLGPVAY